jgi:hypothetical protein
MSKSTVRVEVPRNPEKVMELATKITTKHAADGATSPLNALSDDNWTDNGPRLTQAKDLNTQAKQLEKDVENLYKQRDLLLKPVIDTVKASRDLLLGANKKNPKKLGDWGFVVNDSPKAKKKEEPKP